VQTYLMELVESGMNKRSVKRKLAALRGFYAYLCQQTPRTDNPADHATSPPPPPRLPKTIQEDEVRRILEADVTRAGVSQRKRTAFHQVRGHAFMQLLYATGLRRAELVALNCNDVDPKGKTLRVICKGNEERTVIFNDEAAEALRTYLTVRPNVNDEALFIGSTGLRLGYKHAREIFRAFVTSSGIKKKVTPHVMRHAFATHLLEHGANLTTVQRQLGHKNLATTSIYLHVSPASIREDYENANASQRKKRTTP
jgi:integrase/recombinase XerC